MQMRLPEKAFLHTAPLEPDVQPKRCLCESILQPPGMVSYLCIPEKSAGTGSLFTGRLCLETYGYTQKDDLYEIFRRLSLRLRENSEFPHEIGLFLGYPLADVKGFIENKGRNCKCSGCWKVYEDEEKAQKLFIKYRKCTDIYCQKLKEGTSILRLTVAA